jgi:hypothetical protein
MRPLDPLLPALVALLVATTGCAVLGPPSIRASRAAYNDAIVTTSNQQVLAMIVRMRYGEPSGLLAVSSITANLNIQGRIGSEFGIGPDDNFAGNLTPLSGGIGYEENPTISYTPVQGEAYLRQLLSPLPLDLLVLLLGATNDSPLAITLLVEAINGIRNPEFPTDGDEADPRFERVAGLLAQMSRQGRATWAQERGAPAPFALALYGAGEQYAQQVSELYESLGFAAPTDLDGVLTLPIRLGIGTPDHAAIQLQTRSLYDVLHIAAASVEVPEPHARSGLASPLPALGAAARSLRIRTSRLRPTDAMIAVEHHGWWYSVVGTDAQSKLVFHLVEVLLSARIADAVGREATPVLTIPVSR